MHRIDGAGHVDHLFVAEDQATLRPPTEITPEIMNAFQEELAHFIEWAGLILDKADNTQLKQGLVAKFAGIDTAATKAGIQAQTYTAFTTTGASGAFVLTPAPAINAYAAGQRFRAKFHVAGNGADTINVSGIGAKNLKQYDSTGAKVAPVIAPGQVADVEYDGEDMVIIDQLPHALPPSLPVGGILYVPQASAPTGYLKANGAAISRTAYAALFAVIGTTFGAGDGATTFNLPDLRGNFVRGLDDGRGVDSGRTLGSSQTDAIQNITGSALIRSPGSPTSGAFTQTVSSSVNYGGSTSASQYTLGFDASLVARTAAETRPINVALLACIKF
ncbi:phage tail protein [Azospira sp. APE16]|uniref:phage tail protein n=1 Tax=Azospira sp. APE16 TaxID=3394231 RepID=UPI003A4DEEF4